MNRSVAFGALVAGALAVSLSLPATALAAPAETAANGSELSAKTVFLDPGHQGTGHSEDLNAQVDDGRGGTKNCQTTGMTTLDGVAEHTINWKVSQLVESSLESLGATVVTSRADDSGWGGCVDDRARAATESGADVAVSIHADSTSAGADTDKHGFHLIIPTLPIPDAAANAAQSEGGRSASTLMRDAYQRAGFTPANYAGVEEGLQERSDVAGPALTGVPLVFVEMGNGSNPDDAAVLESPEGQLQHAIALSTGIIDYLLGPDTTVTATEEDVQSDSSTDPGETASTPAITASAPAATASAPAKSGGNALSRLLSGISPYVEAVGVGGLSDLVTEDRVRSVSNVAQGLLKQLLAS